MHVPWNEQAGNGLFAKQLLYAQVLVHKAVTLYCRLVSKDTDLTHGGLVSLTRMKRKEDLHLVESRRLQQIRRKSSGQIWIVVDVKLFYGWSIIECGAEASEVIIL